VSGYIATTKASAYSVSKFAMRSFGMTLHSEIKRFGMNVSNIYPFFSKTGLLNTKPHGTAVMPSLPDFFYDKPASVVKDAIKGIRKNRLHIYPGLFGKPLYYATKLLPIVSDMNK
jgi:short-subunit dehydrogenase